MQIVIDIPIKLKIDCDFNPYNELREAVKNGTPLPKGHGDLIDKGDILHDIDCDEEMRLGKNVEWVREVIRNAPTIIEATEKSI